MWNIGIIGHKIENNNGYYVRDLKKKKQKKNPKLENIYRKEGTLKSDITNLNKEPNKTFRTEKDDDQN